MANALQVSAAHPTRCRTYQAPDPAWAGPELLERVRQRLWAIDPRLNIWWNPHWKPEDREHPGRWAIMFWLQRGQTWSVIEYWEGAGGEFRPLAPESIDELIARLRASEEEADVADKRVRLAEQMRVAKEEDDLAKALDAQFVEARERTFGVKQTFGPGGSRKRRSLARRVNEEAAQAQKLTDEIKADHMRHRQARADEVRRRGRHA